jgi:Flp pilus assembly protein CpaB
VGKRLYLIENVENREMLGAVRPGDKVDIIAHLNVPGYGSVTETVLSGIQSVNLSGTGKKAGDALAFYLTLDEVKIMSFMKNYGGFSVALRNPNDDVYVNTNTITFTSFLQSPTVQKLMKKDDFEIVNKY